MCNNSQDVKRSSHKKLLPFLQSLERKGWIDVKVEDGVATLVAINSSDPDIRKYQPYPESETTEAEEAKSATASTGGAGVGSARATLSVSVVYQTTADTRLLFASVMQKEEEKELARRRAQPEHEHAVAVAETGVACVLFSPVLAEFLRHNTALMFWW